MDAAVDRNPTSERARLLDGRALARDIRADLKSRIDSFQGRHSFLPKLAVVLVGEEPDSVLYSQNLVRWFDTLGLGCSLIHMEFGVTQERVRSEVQRVSADEHTNGLLVQMPLPPHIASLDVFSALDPLKDVEGLHPENIGLLASGSARFVPSTPLAAMELLSAYKVDLTGRHAVILGRSNVVGKPLAQLMLQQDASVTLLHSRSRHIEEHTRRADIVAAAAGHPGLVTGRMLKPGATVLDFGINLVEGTVVGDVAFEQAAAVAGLLTPVPGGIGPLTNLMLARNLLVAAELQVKHAMGGDSDHSHAG